jgi:FixJ family two-component response regulator
MYQSLARPFGAYSFHGRTYQSGRGLPDSLNIQLPSCLVVDLQMENMTGLGLLDRLVAM